MGAHADDSSLPPVRFETHPDRYRHWRLELPPEYGGAVARLVMDVRENEGLRPGYPLKLNSYDLGVDVELADALQRIRFEHPEVKALVFTSGKDRIFCSGANIYMLGSSTHGFKVNFCKFTNETRLYLEEMSAETGVPSLAALAGTASGGGYELAIACDEIVLADDGSSAVSLPEAPLLGVLPGTGGLTRLVDKRKIRRDLADAFSTVAEGVRGKRAVEWSAGRRGAEQEGVRGGGEAPARGDGRAQQAPARRRPVKLEPLGTERQYVTLAIDDEGAHTRRSPCSAPEGAEPQTPDELAKAGSERVGHPRVARARRRAARSALQPPGHRRRRAEDERRSRASVLAVDAMLAKHKDDGLVREVTLLVKRVLKRLDIMAKSLFALVEPGSCFAGSLLEIALAADRIYMLDDPDEKVELRVSAMNAGPLPMANGLTRLQSRFLREPERVARVLEHVGPFDTKAALEAGLVTFAPDDIDWEDEVRIAFEERASLSPDAMTGMEASLRFGGPETMETKIFGRLTAWQNWIFQRPNAVGPRGALTLYGKPERPEFDFKRT